MLLVKSGEAVNSKNVEYLHVWNLKVYFVFYFQRYYITLL